jgi:hypothetical protein
MRTRLPHPAQPRRPIGYGGKPASFATSFCGNITIAPLALDPRTLHQEGGP